MAVNLHTKEYHTIFVGVGKYTDFVTGKESLSIPVSRVVFHISLIIIASVHWSSKNTTIFVNCNRYILQILSKMTLFNIC